jgi:hypothetical protein
LLKQKTKAKSGEDGWEDGQCGLVKEKSDCGASRVLILINVEEAEQIM